MADEIEEFETEVSEVSGGAGGAGGGGQQPQREPAPDSEGEEQGEQGEQGEGEEQDEEEGGNEGEGQPKETPNEGKEEESEQGQGEGNGEQEEEGQEDEDEGQDEQKGEEETPPVRATLFEFLKNLYPNSYFNRFFGPDEKEKIKGQKVSVEELTLPYEEFSWMLSAAFTYNISRGFFELYKFLRLGDEIYYSKETIEKLQGAKNLKELDAKILKYLILKIKNNPLWFKSKGYEYYFYDTLGDFFKSIQDTNQVFHAHVGDDWFIAPAEENTFMIIYRRSEVYLPTVGIQVILEKDRILLKQSLISTSIYFMNNIEKNVEQFLGFAPHEGFMRMCEFWVNEVEALRK